jgi:hypothetical protein
MSDYKIQKINVDKEYISYINVTGITGIIDKSFYLKQWAVDQAIKYIRDNYYNEKSGYHLCELDFDKIKNAHKQTLEDTRDVGSELHNLVETYINIRLKDNDIEPEILLKDYDDQLKAMFMTFYDWQKENVKQFLESEKPVVHRELCYAGTLDFIYIDNDNNIVCCDLKTSNAIYKEHEIQPVAYRYARESMEGDYKVYCKRNGNEWKKIYNYPKIQIDTCGILNITRESKLTYKNINNIDDYFESFKGLLIFFYAYAKRRLNNFRAKERK